MPISGDLEKIINEDTINLKDEEDLTIFVDQKLQPTSRSVAINFLNIGTDKNTIEFRLANGTIDENTWIENVNLFGGIVKAAEDLSKIQLKTEEQRSEEETRILAVFEKLKDEQVSQEEKLEALLEIVIPEEDRDIYRKRYEVNSKLIEENPKIKKIITDRTSKKAVKFKKNEIGKSVFTGEDCVTGVEYNQVSSDISKDLTKENGRGK